MNKWLNLLQEHEKNKNIENPPMSVLSATHIGIFSQKNNNNYNPKIDNPYFSPMSAMSASNSRNNDQKKYIQNKIKNQKEYLYRPADIADIGSIPPNESETLYFPPKNMEDNSNSSLTEKRLLLNDFSSETIVRYRLILEKSYRNPNDDRFHESESPQRFREGTHTFEMMEKAIATFIAQMQSGEAPQWLSAVDATYIRYLDKQEENEEQQRKGIPTLLPCLDERAFPDIEDQREQ